MGICHVCGDETSRVEPILEGISKPRSLGYFWLCAKSSCQNDAWVLKQRAEIDERLNRPAVDVRTRRASKR
jgi:hypothetical protein